MKAVPMAQKPVRFPPTFESFVISSINHGYFVLANLFKIKTDLAILTIFIFLLFLRYLYVFHWKNAGHLNDELLAVMFPVLNMGLT